MNLNFVCRNLDLTSGQKTYIEEKVGKISKYGERLGDESTQGRVEVEEDMKHASGDRITFIATLYVPGSTLRAEVKATTVEEACDLAYEKLKSQAEGYKAKTEHKKNVEIPEQEAVEDDFSF